MDITITLTISVPDGANVTMKAPAKTTVSPPEPTPEPTPEPAPEPTAEIKDPELLTAMAKAAESIGAEKVKEIVRVYGEGVRDVPQDSRAALLSDLKHAVTEPTPTEAAPTNGRRRRRG